METAIDPIKALIETTGLSCDDLLEKLLQYKCQQNKVADQTKEGYSTDNCTESGVEEHVGSTPVILERNCSRSHSGNEAEKYDGSTIVSSERNCSPSHSGNEVQKHIEITPVISETNCSRSDSGNEAEKYDGSTIVSSEGNCRPSHSGNEVEKYIEITPVISERSCNSSDANNSETTSNMDDNIHKQKVPHNGSNINHGINNINQHQEPQVLEKSDTFSGTEAITENMSPAVEHKQDILRVDLEKISNKTLENLKKASTEPTDILKQNNENEEKMEMNKVSSLSIEHQKEILNDPLIQNISLSLVEKNSPLDCEGNVSSESKQNGENRSIQNQLISVNNDNEKEICTFYSTSNCIPKNSNSNSSDTILTNNSKHFFNRRKTISDELVQKLSDRLKQHDEVVNSTSNHKENDIEVCQIEDLEVLPKPMLKLRSDLFTNNFKGNYTSSDNDDENENTPEMKEFLKNIEVVTGEVENSPPPNTCREASKVSPPRVRKIKMGYIKKRILHKAIKCINGIGVKKIEQIKRNKRLIGSEKSNNEVLNTNDVTEEEIRENLKLQLSSLRNRKKDNLIKDKCNIDNLITKYDKHTFDKKKVPNKSMNQTENSTIIEPQNFSANITHQSSITDIDSTTKESLFSLSNDTEFVIVDVQGGVEISDMSETVEKPQKSTADLIKLTKTTDVTKIKGWQNKKFQLCQEENKMEFIKETDIHTLGGIQCDTSVPSCSKVKIIEERNKGAKEELSPFVSNSLEEFLTENSTLNISYNIPKLGAVQGISNQKYDTVIIPQISEFIYSESEKKETERSKSIKPKTLAEKRRMLQNNKQKVVSEEKIFNKKSYVLYNGHKLYVPTTNSEECLVNIKYSPKSNIQHERFQQIIKNKKLSLLDSFYQNSSSVSYKAGPLRKKCRLQNKDSLLHWDTQIRRLPVIKLNVVTEVGKPLPPQLIHYFDFGPKIKQDRLELALSALSNKTGQQQKQGFSLTVPYANNQKYISVRKKKEMPNDAVYNVTPEKNTIGSVLDDIISYVENKENENLIIKDAEIYKEEEKYENKIRASTEVSPAKKAKDRRLKTEISRLSCKVLSVSFDEKEDNRICQKTYCKFGCVCKSLSCVPQLPMHCAKVQCMFECKCSISENISLGVETGALTRDTVTRLEDQAKKNLAKVEKEFTQTIIHANDQTILIPSSDRSKTKRIKRMPKRYSDFMEDFDHKVHSPLIDNQENNSKKISNCYVKLQKLEIKGIIPLCLYHDRYNCTCMDECDRKPNSSSENESHEVAQNRMDRKRKYSTVDKPIKKLDSTLENESYEAVQNKISRKEKYSPGEKKKIIPKELKSISGVSSSGYNTSDSDYIEDIKETKKFKVKEGCARLIGVHPKIIARNEIPFYKNKLKSKVLIANANFIDTTSLPDISYTEPLTESIDIVTPLTISASDRLKLFIMKNQSNKRKQAFDDVDPKYKTKKLKLNEESCENINETFDNKKIENLPYSPVFDGEIIVPTEDNKEFVKKLGMKSAARYMRLLPWDDLLRNYYNHKINIWCNCSFNKLLMNSSDVEPPEGYFDISRSYRKSGIMSWILTKKLPQKTPSELVHLILSPKNDNFEISGICLKNITDEEKAKRVIATDNEKTVTEPSSIVDNVSRSKDNFFEHKNHNNETKLLIMTQKQYNKQLLCVYSNSEQLTDEQFAPLHVRLPTFKLLRWRMLFLNSNFTFLSFENSDYSIKYTDLMNILKKAQSSNMTICLQSRDLRKGYSQNTFGIYAVPKFVDILFIGPYGLNEDHGLKTLRYLRQELVSTTYFEMVQGGVIPNKKKDMWLIAKSFQDFSGKMYIPEKKSAGTSSKLPFEKFNQYAGNSEYAVLTPLPSSFKHLSQDYKNSYFEVKNETAQELHDFHSHLFDTSGNLTTSVDLEEKPFLKFPQFTILNGRKLRTKDFNGYMSTNIPNFGYLGAIQDYETNEIEVIWPFGNKVLRFLNVSYATQFIKRRFDNLLLPVPITFNLQIKMNNDMENLKKMSPVDSKCLNGTHICGCFGILDSRKLTPSLAQTLGTTQEDVLQRLAERAQYLGSLEIDKLKAQEKILINTKKELIMKKQRNLKKYMDLLMILPEEQRLEKYAKFRQEFNGDSSTNSDLNIPSESSPRKSEKIVECIEIEDSDCEGDNSLKVQKNIKSTENTPKKQIMHMRSIVKSNISPQPSQSTTVENESSKPVENFKLVKTSAGKLVLMKDKSGASLSRTLTGMKMKISNNKVVEDKI